MHLVDGTGAGQERILVPAFKREGLHRKPETPRSERLQMERIGKMVNARV